MSHATLDEVAEEWDELATRSGAAPFLRPGWISAWWDAFGGSAELVISILRRGGRLAAVLPLSQTGGVLEGVANWHTPIFGPLATDEDARRAILCGAFESRPRRIDLAFLSGEGSDPQAVREAVVGYEMTRRVILRAPFLAIEGEWEPYWSGLSKNLRGTVKRCRNRLADRGEVAIEVHDGREGLADLLQEGFILERSGWKGDEETAIASRPETISFYESVARWGAEAGILRMPFLRIDGRAVAFNLCLEDGGRHFLLKLGHDAALNRIGPGTVLTAEMVKRSFEIGLDRYEFCGGEDAYKLRWTADMRDLIRVQGFAPTPAGKLDRFVQVQGRSLARRALDAKARARERINR